MLASPAIGWMWLISIGVGIVLLGITLFYGMRNTRRHVRRDPTPEEATRPMYAGNKPAGGGRDSPALSHYPDSVDPRKTRPPRAR